MRKRGTRTDARLVWKITAPRPLPDGSPGHHHTSQRRRLPSLRQRNGKLRSTAENLSYFEQPSGTLTAQHFWKHPPELSHAERPRNEQPILVNNLGSVALPRSRKSVAGEVTGSSGSSPVSRPQNCLPPLTITYVGFLNSFFLHSCLNSTGKGWGDLM